MFGSIEAAAAILLSQKEYNVVPLKIGCQLFWVPPVWVVWADYNDSVLVLLGVYPHAQAAQR